MAIAPLMPAQVATVFGGTGFLGRRVVRHLRDVGLAVRIASRHPQRARALFPIDEPDLESVRADVNQDASVAAAVAGATAVVNAVSLYVERGTDTFHSVHVVAAERVARIARAAGVEKFAHLSGIGSDARSASPYIRSRGQGEEAVPGAFPSATMIRPAVMFGRGDAFAAPVARMLRFMPVFPLFGSGTTRLQPGYVEDVAEAIARVLKTPDARPFYELAGPQVYTYAALLKTIAGGMGKKPILIPFPFALWRALGYVAEFLPRPPITRNQVELMQVDNVASLDAPGFHTLGIAPRPLESVLPEIVQLHSAGRSDGGS